MPFDLGPYCFLPRPVGRKNAFLLCSWAQCNKSRYGLAAVQIAMIAGPMALDCYRGKIQMVEAYAGFAKSRKAGYPTNGFIQALRSEKSVEAPLSLCLQYSTLLHVTTLRAFVFRVLSIALSILNISKFVYATFELGVTDEAAARIDAEDAEDAAPAPVPPRPPVAPAVYPATPPGLPAPTAWRPEPTDAPPGLPKQAIPSHVVAQDGSLPPIIVGHQKTAQKE